MSVRSHAPIQGDAEVTRYDGDQRAWLKLAEELYGPDFVNALLMLRLEKLVSRQVEGLGRRD